MLIQILYRAEVAEEGYWNSPMQNLKFKSHEEKVVKKKRSQG